MKMSTNQIKEKIEKKTERLESYYNREKEMLNGGVQSYGIGSRNLARYNTDLAQIRSAIAELEKDISELENLLNGGSKRKAMGVIPMDW